MNLSDPRTEPAQWYLVQHFAPTDRREANPLRSFVVYGTSHGDALEKVPEHPREWASKVMPVEMLAVDTRVQQLTGERDALLAGLRLVNSMPVNVARERNGYDCAGCGAPLGEEHREGCAWERAMKVLRSEVDASPKEDA